MAHPKKAKTSARRKPEGVPKGPKKPPYLERGKKKTPKLPAPKRAKS